MCRAILSSRWNHQSRVDVRQHPVLLRLWNLIRSSSGLVRSDRYQNHYAGETVAALIALQGNGIETCAADSCLLVFCLHVPVLLMEPCFLRNGAEHVPVLVAACTFAVRTPAPAFCGLDLALACVRRDPPVTGDVLQLAVELANLIAFVSER